MQYDVRRAEGARGPWKVETRAYSYALCGVEGAELLAYHWHPETEEEGRRVREPHLHVRDPRAPRWPLRKAHLPTGRVALEDVVVLAIELGAKPLRRDWRVVLVRTRAAFHRWRTWG
jgi:hypothetical protein